MKARFLSACFSSYDKEFLKQLVHEKVNRENVKDFLENYIRPAMARPYPHVDYYFSRSALECMALLSVHPSLEVRRAFFLELPSLIHHFYHLLRFASACSTYRRFGRGLRRAISEWLLRMPYTSLAVLAYGERNRTWFFPGEGRWSLKLLISLTHPKAYNEQQNLVIAWALGRLKKNSSGNYFREDGAEVEVPEVIRELDNLPENLSEIIQKYRLRGEHLLPPRDLSDSREIEITELCRKETIDALLIRNESLEYWVTHAICEPRVWLAKFKNRQDIQLPALSVLKMMDWDIPDTAKSTLYWMLANSIYVPVPRHIVVFFDVEDTENFKIEEVEKLLQYYLMRGVVLEIYTERGQFEEVILPLKLSPRRKERAESRHWLDPIVKSMLRKNFTDLFLIIDDNLDRPLSPLALSLPEYASPDAAIEFYNQATDSEAELVFLTRFEDATRHYRYLWYGSDRLVEEIDTLYLDKFPDR